jgi:hypothetical protein
MAKTCNRATACIALGTSILAIGLTLAGPAAADECLLDTNNNGVADAADTDGGAYSDRSGTDEAVACGKRANAGAPRAVAIGSGTRAMREGAVAIGSNSNSDALSGVAIGDGSNASGYSGSVAVGNFASSFGGISLGKKLT